MNLLKSLMPMSDSVDVSNLSSIIGTISSVVSVALGIITVGVVIVAIMIGIKFFTADDDAKRKNAKQQLIYAIIGVVVLLALMALAPVITQAIKNSASQQSAGTMFILF